MENICSIYTETKKFSNTSHLRIFITETQVKINTNLIRFFFFALNVITILSNAKYCKISFVWSAVTVINCFSKGQNVNILNILYVHRRRFLTVLIGTFVPETVARCYTKRVCCKKCHPSWSYLHETFLQWSCFFLCLSDLGRFPANFVCTKAIVLWISKWKRNLINVETSIRHVNHSAVFVPGRLLRFHIPNFHQIPVSCWCLLPSSLVNIS